MADIRTLQRRKHDAYQEAKMFGAKMMAEDRKWTPQEEHKYDSLLAEVAALDVEIARITGIADGASRDAGLQARTEMNPARRKQILANIGDFFRPGGRVQDIRADSGTDFTVSEGELLIPSEVVGPLVTTATVYDECSQLGVNDFPRTSINPITRAVLGEPTPAATVDELTDIPSALPVLIPIQLGGTKDVTQTTMSWEALASLLSAFQENKMLQNSLLSEAVIAGIQMGILKIQNAKFRTKLRTDLLANSHAVYLNNYGSDTLIDIIGYLQSTLPIQFRDNAKFYFGKSAQLILQQAVDTLGRRLFPEMPSQLAGKPVVISEDMSGTEIYYGDFSRGAYRSLSPLMLRQLTEVRALEGANVYLGAQFSDYGTFAGGAPSTVQQPVLLTNLEYGGS